MNESEQHAIEIIKSVKDLNFVIQNVEGQIRIINPISKEVPQYEGITEDTNAHLLEQLSPITEDEWETIISKSAEKYKSLPETRKEAVAFIKKNIKEKIDLYSVGGKVFLVDPFYNEQMRVIAKSSVEYELLQMVPELSQKEWEDFRDARIKKNSEELALNPIKKRQIEERRKEFSLNG